MSAIAASAIWHDVECGAYEADLELWEELAEASGGRVLDLGCGTGRVSLHLARRGRSVLGLDHDPGLVEQLNARADGLPAAAMAGDACDFRLDERFELILAPMQLLQLFASAAERVDCLRAVAAHLAPRGRFAAAIVEEMPAVEPGRTPLPDAREIDGWVYSSLPVDAFVDADSIHVRRLRQAVSPDGELTDEDNEVVLRRLGAAELEREAAEAGLQPAARRAIPVTDAHVGSTAVIFERTY